MEERRINLDEKPDVREISVYELMERLSIYKRKPLRLANENDYECYYMAYSKYETDKKEGTMHIGYSQDVHLEGVQFCTVCTVKDGKIHGLELNVGIDTINLSRLYIDNLLGKNRITSTSQPNGYEMPY